MKDLIDKDELLLFIDKQQIQNQALMKLGKKLNDEEMKIVSKGLHSGLTHGVEITINTIFNEMIER